MAPHGFKWLQMAPGVFEGLCRAPVGSKSLKISPNRSKLKIWKNQADHPKIQKNPTKYNKKNILPVQKVHIMHKKIKRETQIQNIKKKYKKNKRHFLFGKYNMH